MVKKSMRVLKKYYLMLLRSKGTPHSLALGVAFGLFAGCIVPVGQIILAVILAFVFRANKWLATAATFVSNPYTYFIMYPAACLLGAKLLGVNLAVGQINHAVHLVVHEFSFAAILDLGGTLILSFLAGGALMGIVAGVVGYILTFRIVKLYRRKKDQVRTRQLRFYRDLLYATGK